MLLAMALKGGDAVPESVRDFLLYSKNISGMSRDFNFNGRRSAPAYEVMYRIQNGKFVEVGPKN